VTDDLKPAAVVVMGPSGCGKSTLAAALAARLGWRFIEGDELHPPANTAKMASGIPLTDQDRAPFLEAVADAIALQRGSGVVAACSALKRRYRDLLRARGGPILFVLPQMDRADLLARLKARQGHFMPASLLDSQLADLEPPDPDEQALVLPGAAPLEQNVTLAIEGLRTLTGG
jgi:gluconokinase